jgi:hypothetical protein
MHDQGMALITLRRECASAVSLKSSRSYRSSRSSPLPVASSRQPRGECCRWSRMDPLWLERAG